MKNVCDDCGWVVSEYQYTYDDRGFIVGEDVLESLYAYAWDDKHDGRHENGKHDTQYPHGDTHNNKHDKDAKDNYQIIGTKRTFEYDDDGKLLKATEEEERQGTYVYTYRYDDMGNRTFYSKTRNGTVIESAEYTYNASNQKISAKLYDGKKNTTMKYEYDADGNLISETGKKGTDKVELTYDYTVENRLKAVFDADELLVAAAYDGDGNRLFQLNYNLHTDDDWKGNSGNGNGNNKDNSGSGNNGNSGISGVISEALSSVVDFFTGTVVETAAEPETEAKSNGNKNKDKGNDGNATNNGKGNGNGKDNSSGNNGNNSNSGNNGNGYSGNNGNNGNNGNGNNNGNTGTGSTNNGSDTANGSGNTNNTGGSENQSGILMPKKPVSDVEQGLIDLIKTTGKHKNYELIEYVNDVNREYTEVLMEVNIDGEMDTAYTYGNKRLALERFTSWTGYYTNDPRGSVTGVTGSEGTLWKSYRYSPTGDITFGKPEYNNAYSYNAEDYNPNLEFQYLRARYYDVERGDFVTEDTYLGNITDPLTLNRYNYVKSSAPNYVDSSGHMPRNILNSLSRWYNAGIIEGKGLSTLTLLLNGMGVETALHEIAQLNMAKDLYTRGYSPKLEVEIFAPSLKKKIYNASDASRANNCTWQEIDIVAKGYIWEIKSIGQVLTPSKLGSAEKQLDNYLTAGQDIYQEGTREIFSGITGVEVLGDIKMNVKPTLKRSGVIEYDFYKDDDGERVTVVSFSAVREQYKKRQKEALEAIGGIMILTILEDIISVGAGTLDDLPSFLVALGRATVILATP